MPTDVTKHCLKCHIYLNARKNIANNDFDYQSIMRARRSCASCRGNDGIYKFDAIYTALGLHEQLIEQLKKFEKLKLRPELTPGKKPVKEKLYGDIVRNLRKENKSIREIARITNLSTPTVQKILKNQKN